MEKYTLPPNHIGMLYDYYFSKVKNPYMQQHVWTLNEQIDVDAFENAWRSLIELHDILRTTYDLRKKAAFIHNSFELNLLFNDWSKFSKDEQNQMFRTFIKEDRQKTLQINDNPPMRFALFKFALNEYCFVWTSHQISLDGRGRILLIKDFFLYYESFCKNEDIQISPKVPFNKYAEWLTKQDFTDSKDYWKKQLMDFKTPLDFSKYENTKSPKFVNSDHKSIQLEEQILKQLKEIAGKNNVTVNTIVQAVYILMLYKYLNINDIVIGVVRSCRHNSIPDAPTIIGLLINTVPIRYEVNLSDKLEKLLFVLRKQWIDMKEYVHTPVNELVKCLKEFPPKKNIFNAVLMFDTKNINEQLHEEDENKWCNRTFYKIENNTADFELDITAYKNINIMLEYDASRFSTSLTDSMLKDIRNLFLNIIDHPGSTIKNILQKIKSQ
ncbi:MAG: hypothetical protein GY936_05870 [Ignavibacteriae bacterium]|nr:hypothetical protein [Ignavibacteriota bacterium]